MPCEKVPFADKEGFVILCSRGRRRRVRCTYCSGDSSRLCDYPVTRNGQKATCDAPLCGRCTQKIAGDGDLCREHAPFFKTMGGKP